MSTSCEGLYSSITAAIREFPKDDELAMYAPWHPPSPGWPLPHPLELKLAMDPKLNLKSRIHSPWAQGEQSHEQFRGLLTLHPKIPF